MALATDEAGIQFRILNSSKGPAVRATRAQADRVLYKQAIRRASRTQPNLTLFQQAGRRSHARRRRGRRARDGRHHATRHSLRGGCRRADHRDLPVGPDPCRPRALRGRPRRRSAGEDAGRATARAEAARRAAQDRHAAASRRPHDRFLACSPCSPATIRRRCSRFMGTRAMHPRQVAVLDHAHERAHARDHPRRPRPFAAVHRRDQGRRAALLPVDRGQGRALRRARRATRSSSSPKASRRTRSIRTGSRRRCRSTCSWSSCARSRAARTRTSCGPATRSSTTISIRAHSSRRSRPRRSAASSSPDRSTARPATRRPPRKGCSPASTRRASCAARPAGARAATRPTSACSSTI